MKINCLPSFFVHHFEQSDRTIGAIAIVCDISVTSLLELDLAELVGFCPKFNVVKLF